MPIGIVIAVSRSVSHCSRSCQSFRDGIQSAERMLSLKLVMRKAEAREIIDDAVKTAEAKKKESLLEIKEESIKTKNELEKETKERRAELQRYEKRVLSKEESLDKKSDAIERREAAFTAKEEQFTSA